MSSKKRRFFALILLQPVWDMDELYGYYKAKLVMNCFQEFCQYFTFILLYMYVQGREELYGDYKLVMNCFQEFGEYPCCPLLVMSPSKKGIFPFSLILDITSVIIRCKYMYSNHINGLETLMTSSPILIFRKFFLLICNSFQLISKINRAEICSFTALLLPVGSKN
jgi:hypothetical protein